MDNNFELNEGQQRRFEYLKSLWSLTGKELTLEGFKAMLVQEQMCRKYGADNL